MQCRMHITVKMSSNSLLLFCGTRNLLLRAIRLCHGCCCKVHVIPSSEYQLVFKHIIFYLPVLKKKMWIELSDTGIGV